ncbi:MAG: GTP cyclohydrolase I FolE [Lachnospiraceae bacterium]|jgi:GTP cyclohydrolase I|nr:GTP cyclohydrolase I FolE [Lachnospiraceae bacterium]
MVDEEKIRKAVEMLLAGIGEDPGREGLRETPDRVARMYGELAAGYDRDPGEYLQKTFTSAAKGIVLEKDIRFYSLCEHHLLPFFGTVAIGYLPDGKVAGLSKLARTVEVYARRLQLQERLTEEIADAVMEGLSARGVMVYVTAEHLCMSMRGVSKPGTKTSTVAVRGEFEKDEKMRNLFFRMLEER